MENKTVQQKLAERAAQNQRRGRPCSLSLASQAKLVADYLGEDKPSLQELGDKYGVSKAVAFRVIKKAKKS